MSLEKKVKIKIDKEKCKGCGLCVNFCPKEDVLYMSKKETNKKGYQFVKKKKNYQSNCLACGSCYIVCPDACIEIIKDSITWKKRQLKKLLE